MLYSPNAITQPMYPPPGLNVSHLSESGWSSVREDFLSRRFGDTMWKREFQVLYKELFNVGATNGIEFINLDNSENLPSI